MIIDDHKQCNIPHMQSCINSAGGLSGDRFDRFSVDQKYLYPWFENETVEEV